jgi:ketosteroid isomerase-like protein
MTSIPRFAAYAAAFEKAYATDDWSLLEPFFAEDAVYEIRDVPAPFGGVQRGRDAILAYFARVVNAFDRRFATREVLVRGGPLEKDGAVWVKGAARYTAPGVPELVFELEESAWFDGDRIRRLEDRYDAAEVERLQEWVGAHGGKLGVSVG